MAGRPRAFKVIAYKVTPGGAAPAVHRYDSPAEAMTAAMASLLDGCQVRVSDAVITAYAGHRAGGFVMAMHGPDGGVVVPGG